MYDMTVHNGGIIRMNNDGRPRFTKYQRLMIPNDKAITTNRNINDINPGFDLNQLIGISQLSGNPLQTPTADTHISFVDDNMIIT